MNKKLIRLTESDLHRIVRESVNNVLTELDWKTYANAADKSYKRIATQSNDPAVQAKNRRRANEFAKQSDISFNRDFGGYDRYVDDDGKTVDYHYGRVGSPNNRYDNTSDGSIVYSRGRDSGIDTHPGSRSFTNSVYDFDDYEDGVEDAYWSDGAEYHSKPRLKDGKYPLRDRGNKETSDYVNGKYHYEKGKGWKK